MRKTIKFNLGDKDIIADFPEEFEVTNKEAFGLMAIETQDQIAKGNVRVTKRVWPCILCGKEYKSQTNLGKHLETHTEMINNLKAGPLKRMYENEPQEPTDEL